MLKLQPHYLRLRFIFVCALTQAALSLWAGGAAHAGIGDDVSLKGITSVKVELPGAAIKFLGEKKQGKSTLAFAALDEKNCPLSVRREADELKITRGLEATTDGSTGDLIEWTKRCMPDITLNVVGGIDAHVIVDHLLLQAQDWSKGLAVKMIDGNVAFSDIAELDIECKSCDLGGENMTGSLKYVIGVGTVGARGLSSSVLGRSKGDVTLRWARFKAKTTIDIETEHGDISIQVPASAAIAPVLSAPKGDIFLKKVPVGGGSSGASVALTTAIGNIRLYK